MVALKKKPQKTPKKSSDIPFFTLLIYLTVSDNRGQISGAQWRGYRMH